MKYNNKDFPWKEAWIPISAYSIIKWLRENNDEDTIYISSQRVEGALDEIQDYLFNKGYSMLGLKPISKCSIEELEAEIRKRKSLEEGE